RRIKTATTLALESRGGLSAPTCIRHGRRGSKFPPSPPTFAHPPATADAPNPAPGTGARSDAVHQTPDWRGDDVRGSGPAPRSTHGHRCGRRLPELRALRQETADPGAQRRNRVGTVELCQEHTGALPAKKIDVAV